ncbi:MAG TPA: DNA internalization-related competence protein ComEC/Rec2, partial [Coxiellaceae bacterium]|nr:DNA internalization-related competence protein ComEC/Rec2 [Coxiellaceae bacterium]
WHSNNINATLLLSWYQYPPALKVGQQWQLIVKLKPPIGTHNPGGFDYAQFLMMHGISATGFVVAHAHNQWLGTQHVWLQTFRENTQQQIQHAIHNPMIAAFISALSVGLRDGFNDSDWMVFRNTGTNHLVAIAGLHIGFVFAVFYFLLQWGWRQSSFLLLHGPAKRFALLGGLIAAFLYACVSGFALPAQRAIVMLVCLIAGEFFYRPITLTRRLLYAAWIILLLNPLSFYDSSFWLSFCSIALLGFVMSGRLQQSNQFISWSRMQLAILIGLLPLMLLYFQQISLIAFFTNAIAIPWIGFVILPITLMATVCHSATLFYISGQCLAPLWYFLQSVSSFSWSTWHHAVINPFVLIASTIGIFFLIAPCGFKAKWLGCFGLLPLFFYTPSTPKHAQFWVSVIDVGQGLSVLVQTQHHVMLYDAGAHYPDGFDFGESVVAPYLRRQGISRIDRLEISHGDNDHSGGVSAIMHDFTVKNVFTSAPRLVAQWRAHYCVAGQNWLWDGVQFQTLNPASHKNYQDNNSSCVIKISNNNTSMLLTGDIQAETEARLVKRYGSQLQSTILLVPHHGSRTSSSELFLNTVSPREAIISAGKYNHYHLPAPSVVARYQKRHMSLYNTADDGEISVRFLALTQVRLFHEK